MINFSHDMQVLDGQKVFPKRAQELGFKYKYPHVSDAIRAIISS
jgi:NAD dependent epimerase/dehydratase family enzyme